MSARGTSTHPWFFRLHFGVWLALIPFFFGLNLAAAVPLSLATINSVARQIIGCGLTLALWRIYRRWEPRSVFAGHRSIFVLLLCLAATLLEFVLIGALRTFLGPAASPTSEVVWFAALVMRMSLYVVWSTLYFALRNWLESRDRELAFSQTETAAREAELVTLRAQINPHFLFNALNSILAEADDNPRAVKSIAHALADYLRFSLRQQSHHLPLGEEIEALDNYLVVEKARFEEKLSYHLSVADSLRTALVPTAVLLPLVENAIKYGMRTSPPPLRVTISALARDGRLVLAVENTGRWIEPRPDAPDSTKIGLANLRRRLALLHPDDARLHITHDDTCVRIEVSLTLVHPSA